MIEDDMMDYDEYSDDLTSVGDDTWEEMSEGEPEE
jgi:hypothetical protein